MGILWELFQQSKIDEQDSRGADLDDRVGHLESELKRTQSLLHELIGALEKRFGDDIDKDGSIG